MSADLQFKQLIDRILRCREAEDEAKEDTKTVYAELKSAGFDKTAAGALVSELRKKNKDGDKFVERNAILDLYRDAYERASGMGLATHTHAREHQSDSGAFAGVKAQGRLANAAGVEPPLSDTYQPASSQGAETGAGNAAPVTTSASDGRPESSKRLQVLRELTNAAEPDAATCEKSGYPKRRQEKERIAAEFSDEPAAAADVAGDYLREPAAAASGQIIREGDAPRETGHQASEISQGGGDASCPDTEFQSLAVNHRSVSSQAAREGDKAAATYSLPPVQPPRQAETAPEDGSLLPLSSGAPIPDEEIPAFLKRKEGCLNPTGCPIKSHTAALCWRCNDARAKARQAA